MSSKAVKMTREEWNKAIDEHLENDKKLIGKERVLKTETESVMSQGINPDKMLTAGMFVDYARCGMGTNNPLYTDPGYGKYTRYGSIIAPPGFFNTPAYYINNMNIPGVVFMHKGTKYIHYKPIIPGDEITITQKYRGYTEKKVQDKPYRMFTTEFTWDGHNQRGELVVGGSRGQLITATYPEGEGAQKSMSGAYKGREKPTRYTQKELDKYNQYYEEILAGKHRRGAQIRYWEDVAEGEELPALKEGPITLTDTAAAMGGFGRGVFAMRWAIDKFIRAEKVIDPESNVMVYEGVSLHLSDTLVKNLGFPRAVAPGLMADRSFAHMITNWMGDDGWLNSFETQIRGMRFTYDCANFTGKVIKKYVENGEHLVDLELLSVIPNANDARQAMGNATVKLISREG